MRQHARSFSGTSQRSNSRAGSVSSDGNMDDEDEEPFSTASSAVAAVVPKQDVLPRRPQPGGRFPSDLEVSRARGLQVPLSPSSGSSNFEDRYVNAAAAGLPGSGIGEHYAQETHPTHAALVDKAAEQDGINPYTSQPVSHQNLREDSRHIVEQHYNDEEIPDGAIAGGAGVTGAVLGAASYQGYQSHHQHKYEDQETFENQNPSQRVQSEYAALRSAELSSSQQHQQAEQAAYEATLIAAPDTAPGTRTFNEYTAGGVASQSAPIESLVATGRLPSDQQSVNPAKDILDPLAEDLAKKQPSFAAGQDHSSVASISQLHIPGSFS